MRSGERCPVCGNEEFGVDRTPAEIDSETELRRSFVIRNLGRIPAGLEAVDLTEFMHGSPARLLVCRNCGMLFRDEREQSHYEDDRLDLDVMQNLYGRNLQSFERRKALYQPLLRKNAEVLEVGSHLGAFLETAEEWGWRPTGLDIGESSSHFARKQGATVRRLTIDDYSPHLRKPEGIFVWNCFEQLDDPIATLRRSFALLDRYGLLILRIPNANFYMHQRARVAARGHAWRTLGYNNLLGFPYLHGYTLPQLDRMLNANGFSTVAVHPTNLLALPYTDLSPRMKREWRHIEGHGGAWLEVVCRKSS